MRAISSFPRCCTVYFICKSTLSCSLGTLGLLGRTLPAGFLLLSTSEAVSGVLGLPVQDTGTLGQERRATKMMKGVERVPHGERVGELVLFNLKKTRVKENVDEMEPDFSQ